MDPLNPTTQSFTQNYSSELLANNPTPPPTETERQNSPLTGRVRPLEREKDDFNFAIAAITIHIILTIAALIIETMVENNKNRFPL